MITLNEVGFVVNPDNGHIGVLGRNFPTREQAEAFLQQKHAELSKLAGRPVTARELRNGGIERTDDRTESQKMADSRWRPTLAESKSEPVNPFERMKDEGILSEAKPRKESLASFRDRMAKAWDERHTPPAEPDKRREAAIQAATDLLERVSFDSRAPMSAVESARQLLEQARVGCLDTFKEQYNTRIVKEKDAAEQLRAAVMAKLAELPPVTMEEFEAEQQYKPEPDYFYQDEASRAARERARQQNG